MKGPRTAEDIVRSPRLWLDLAEVLRQQAEFMEEIAEAIEANDFETMRNTLQALVRLVKSRQPILERLSPAIGELMAEIFEA